MKRGEALTLLKELKASFESLESTKWVLLKNDEKEGFLELQIKWTPQPYEEQTLQSLAAKHNLKICSKEGQIIFRRTE